MRLWSLHPQYLDAQGLVALWREALLARAVLQGNTRGYRNHPQLERFKQHPNPVAAIEWYLQGVYAQACQRGYRFNAAKLSPDQRQPSSILVSTGQLQYEWQHLLNKLHNRSPQVFAQWQHIHQPQWHQLFQPTAGAVATWERC